MKWKDIFEDPDMVGQTEYLAIHEAIATAVMGTDSPDPEQKVSRVKQQQIAEMLEEIGSQARRLTEALSKRLPVKTYWRACDCNPGGRRVGDVWNPFVSATDLTPPGVQVAASP